MFGPLNFPSENTTSPMAIKTSLMCFLCDKEFDADEEIDNFCNHIKDEHNVLIKNYEQILNLSGYVNYWKDKFKTNNLTDFCLVEEGKSSDESSNQGERKIMILCDEIKEDKELREKLLKDSLEKALERQKLEREDTNFIRRCLFCNHDIKSTRADYLKHLSFQHNLQLGKPDNLVYIDKFIGLIERKIENLKCIFCEKTFKDRPVLKEHMRKKLHKRVNPNNPMYDQFYVANYLAPRKIAKKASERKRRRSPDSEDGECDWSDWKEEAADSVVCLFCTESLPSWDAALGHLEGRHGFRFLQAVADLNFYQKVKLVNFIRHQIYKNACIICDFNTVNRESLLKHMEEDKHFVKPMKDRWDQPEFFFPTYENDVFLCHLDNSGSNSEDEMDNKVSPAFKSKVEELKCLLCDESHQIGENLLVHMSNVHDFHYYDFNEDFNFMDRVKLINYFRLCLLKLECVNCNVKMDSHQMLLDHMKDSDHFIAPPKEVWCKPENQHSQNIGLQGIDTVDFIYALEDIGSMAETPLDEQDERGEYSDFEDDDIPLMCLFCKTGSSDWSSALGHMISTHSYDFLEVTKDLSFYEQVQLVNYIRKQIKEGVCPVCSSVPTPTLLEHMEKEKHFTLPQKELWCHSKYLSSHFVGDPFLSELNVRHATDFVEPSAESIKEMASGDTCKKAEENDDSSDWSDWDEDMKIIVKCLFCIKNFDKWQDVLGHMTENHKFDYQNLTKNINFYDQVKMVNFIRKCMLKNKCHFCEKEEDCLEKVSDHMLQENHTQLPDKKLWDNNEYFSPVIENDGFLAHLDDSDSDG